MWLSFYWKTFLLNFTQRLRNRSQVKSMRLNPPFIKHVAFLIYSHHSFLFKFGNKYTIIFKIFWEFLMFYQIFLSPQVKQWTIISCKHGIYFGIHGINDLRLKDLRILGNICKVSKLHKMIAQCPVSLRKWKFC